MSATHASVHEQAQQAIDECDAHIARLDAFAAEVRSDCAKRLETLATMREDALELRRQACAALVDLGPVPERAS